MSMVNEWPKHLDGPDTVRHIGIDPSTKRLAIVWRNRDDTFGVEVVKFVRGPRFTPDLCLQAFFGIEALLADLRKVDGRRHMVWLEEPVYLRNHRSVVVQSYINGGVMAGAFRAGAQVHLVSSTAWKKTLGIGGRGSKAEVAERIQSTTTLQTDDADVLDAAGILLHAERAHH